MKATRSAMQGGFFDRRESSMKYIANIITIVRMILSVLLICLLNNRSLFLIVFIICGISDVIDGFIARKTNTGSAVGARLDSFADLLLFGISTICIIVWAGEDLKGFLPYLAVVILIRFANIAIAAFKYHSFSTLHTWGNKITGILVFISYAVFIISDNIKVFLPVCILAALSALEETVIHMTSSELNLNRRSILNYIKAKGR
jgi:phosphatidylglycerophosphate synthase